MYGKNNAVFNQRDDSQESGEEPAYSSVHGNDVGQQALWCETGFHQRQDRPAHSGGIRLYRRAGTDTPDVFLGAPASSPGVAISVGILMPAFCPNPPTATQALSCFRNGASGKDGIISPTQGTFPFFTMLTPPCGDRGILQRQHRLYHRGQCQ